MTRKTELSTSASMTIRGKRTYLLAVVLLLWGQLLLSFHHHPLLQQADDCQICLQAQGHSTLPTADIKIKVEDRSFPWLKETLSHSCISAFIPRTRARAPPFPSSLS